MAELYINGNTERVREVYFNGQRVDKIYHNDKLGFKRATEIKISDGRKYADILQVIQNHNIPDNEPVEIVITKPVGTVYIGPNAGRELTIVNNEIISGTNPGDNALVVKSQIKLINNGTIRGAGGNGGKGGNGGHGGQGAKGADKTEQKMVAAHYNASDTFINTFSGGDKQNARWYGETIYNGAGKPTEFWHNGILYKRGANRGTNILGPLYEVQRWENVVLIGGQGGAGGLGGSSNNNGGLGQSFKTTRSDGTSGELGQVGENGHASPNGGNPGYKGGQGGDQGTGGNGGDWATSGTNGTTGADGAQGEGNGTMGETGQAGLPGQNAGAAIIGSSNLSNDSILGTLIGSKQ